MYHRDGRRVSTPRNRTGTAAAAPPRPVDTASWLPMLTFTPSSIVVEPKPRGEVAGAEECAAASTANITVPDSSKPVVSRVASSLASPAARQPRLSATTEMPSPFSDNACAVMLPERDAVFNVLEFVIDHARQRLGRAPPNVAHGLKRDEYGNLQVRVSFYFGQLDQICVTYTWTTLTNETLVPLSFQAPSVHINTSHINAGFQEYGLVRNLRPIISKDGCNYNGWRCLLTVRTGANVPEQITIVDRNFPSESAVQLAVADDRTYCDKHYYMLPSFCGCLSGEAKTEAKAKAKTERGEAKTSE
ncbi:hypothetical protein DL89DRAFT_321324 [Linderina pennispora]|uniref:Uncharacterized protein n=1 Tax=Linderina pennispora TaxID=61395 RepID=A0A1Y1WFH9_9FUNG|nr:uncharacterized protein DL89DRAFT_321324 [Linderina pennispora]ORX72247.1 hypothetical protein DL89DRAFT_321324 [Linderina pennispora]